MAETTTCRTCKRQWQSLTQAHCLNCHQQFSGPTAFDDHQLHQGTNNLRCRTHEEMLTGQPPTRTGTLRKKMIQSQERYGRVWRYEGKRPIPVEDT